MHCNQHRLCSDILTGFESILEINYWIDETYSWVTHVCMGDLHTHAESIRENAHKVTQADRNFTLFFMLLQVE